MITEGNRDYIDHEVDEDNVSIIVYTSGTTGKSKGVMLSHKNIAIDCSSAAKNCDFQETHSCYCPASYIWNGSFGSVFDNHLWRNGIY